MLGRPAVFVKGQLIGNPSPFPLMTQRGIATDATNGDATMTAEQVAMGVINRTTVGAGYTQTWPTADSLLALMDNPQVGDEFPLIYRNSIAQAMTFAAGTGIVSGIGTLSCAASKVRHYSFTILSNKRTVTIPCTTTNGNKFLTNVPVDQLKNVMPGMGVTGTGIGASALVVGVKEETNASTGAITGTITVDVNSTATADNIGVTFNPRIRLDSFGLTDL